MSVGGKISLRALEIFEITAQTGSVAEAARRLDCSVSAASRHLKRLEGQLGVALIDHERRPMAPTAAGRALLRRVEVGLHNIRLGVRETMLAEGLATSSLAIGVVEELESGVVAALIAHRSERAPGARFVLSTQPSHEALAMLRERKLDLAVASEPPTALDDLVAAPLVRDPFVVAAPRRIETTPDALFSGVSPLRFVRYNPAHLIGRQIAAHLRRLRVALDGPFEIDSTEAMLDLVATGDAWSLTTALAYARAARFHEAVSLHPAPIPAFSRTLSLFARRDAPPAVMEDVAASLRLRIAAEAIEPMAAEYPWLGERMTLLGQPADSGHADAGHDDAGRRALGALRPGS